MPRADERAARAALPGFGLPADARLTAIVSGHINGTWRVTSARGDAALQWLNDEVFAATDGVQDNVETVLDHLRAGAPAVLVPTLLRARDGARRFRDATGLWRLFAWMPERRVHEAPVSADMARAAGEALGAALRGLADLPTARIRPVLAGFHDLGARLAAFDAARAIAEPGRSAEAAGLLARLDGQRRRREAAAPFHAAPRVLHGDPKFTNFLFPATGTDPVALLDWDTAMIGPLAWDFGDFLRSAASRGAEDEPAAAAVDEGRLLAGAEGFLAGLAEPIDARDHAALAAAPAHMAFMLAVRFLTDHLAGDRYFRVRRPRQNLDRAATQFALAAGFDATAPLLRERLAAVGPAAAEPPRSHATGD